MEEGEAGADEAVHMILAAMSLGATASELRHVTGIHPTIAGELGAAWRPLADRLGLSKA